jgi:quercetin dioxygenase-like cupin family protein
MSRYALWCLATMAIALGVHAYDQHSGTVEKSGMTSEMKFEHILSGHVAELNGRYKLRVSESRYEPGGHIGEHHHAGPGIRLVTAGELEYVQPDKTTVYKTGDYFYESGDVQHTGWNRGKADVRVLNFEILPADWKRSSALPVPAAH